MIGVAYFLSRREPLSRIIAPWVLHDLGNLLLAFVMLWAYMSFAQFLIIWVENLQHEIPWYLHRINGGWGVHRRRFDRAAIRLAVCPAVVAQPSNAKPRTLCAVAGAIALMHLIELFWFVAPTFHPDGFSLHWTTLLAPLGIGGLWFAAFLGQLRDRPLLPFRDPRFIAIVEEQGWVPHG